MYYKVYTATQTYHAPKAGEIFKSKEGAGNLIPKDQIVRHRERVIWSPGVKLANSVEHVRTPSFQYEKTRGQNQKKAERIIC